MKELDLSSWYTLEQTIDKLRQSARTVYRLRKEKQIRCMIRREKGVRPTPVYNPEDVEKVCQAAVDADISRTKPAVANGKNGELTKATTTTAPKTLMRAATKDDTFALFMEFIRGMAAQAAAVSQVRPFMTIEEASEYSGLSQALLLTYALNRARLGTFAIAGSKLPKFDLDDFAGRVRLGWIWFRWRVDKLVSEPAGATDRVHLGGGWTAFDPRRVRKGSR